MILAGSLTLLPIIMEVEMSPSNSIFLSFGAVFRHDYGRKGKDLVAVLPKHRNSTNSPGILWVNFQALAEEARFVDRASQREAETS